jgi:alkylation response protein AidB-like acyl-CoA dehydrogenase
MTEAGLFKLAVPRRYGGYQTSVRTMLEVSAAVGEADGGTAWVLTLCNGCAWLTGLFGERAQNDVFGADPDARVCGVLAPTAEVKRVTGGFRVTGRWYYTSGSWHASWAVLGIPVTNDAGEVVDQGLALVPAQDYQVEDTWYVAGMRSSGSNCVVADDVFVPEHRVLSVPPAIEGRYATERTEETLFRSAFVPVLALILIGPQLGLGRAALRLVIDKAARKPISYTFFDRQVDSTAFQLQVAGAAMKIDTATLHAHRAAADIDDAAASGEYPDFPTRARVRADTGRIAEFVIDAIGDLLFAHGAGSFAEVNPLQRIWRDANVAARHAIVTPAIGYEIYGKALLGVEEKITPLI